MSMIKCPECGKDVSDKAQTCPNCGTPISVSNSVENSDVDSNIGTIGVFKMVFGAIAVIGFILMIFVSNFLGGLVMTIGTLFLIILGERSVGLWVALVAGILLMLFY